MPIGCHLMILLRAFAVKLWGSFVLFFFGRVASLYNLDNIFTDIISEVLGCHKFEDLREVVVGLGLQALRFVLISVYGMYILYTNLGFHITVL